MSDPPGGSSWLHLYALSEPARTLCRLVARGKRRTLIPALDELETWAWLRRTLPADVCAPCVEAAETAFAQRRRAIADGIPF